MKEKFSSFINKIPEFSDRNFVYASYACGALVAASALFFMYEMFTTPDFGISVQWNIFRSRWFTPLFIIGFLLAIVNWGKLGHWSFKTINVYKDRYGNRREEESNDIGDATMGGCIMPLLGHFVIEPIIYACIIFYPLMCVFALVGVILPYLISLLLIALVVAIFKSNRFAMQLRCHSLILILVTLLVGGGLTWSSVIMAQAKTPQEHRVTDDDSDDLFGTTDTTETSSTEDDMFSD